MLNLTPPQTPVRNLPVGTESPVLKETLKVHRNIKIVNNSLRWGAVNALGAAIFSYDMSLTNEKKRTIIYSIEYVLVVIFTLNTLYHIYRYMYSRFTTCPVPVTPHQKKLLGFKDSDVYYKLVNQSTPLLPAIKKSSSVEATPINTSALSWRSTSSSQNDSIYSVPSPSWIYYRGSPGTIAAGGVNSPSSAAKKSRVEETTAALLRESIPDTSGVEYISDERSLSQYLKDYEQHEKMLNASINQEDTSVNLLSSFWNHPATRACSEVPAYLKNSTYQLASQTMEKLTGSPGKSHVDVTTSPITLQNQAMEVWNYLKIPSDTLTLWHSNLRMWIHQTILARLVAEINSVNESLHRHSFVDVQIGAVGLERLRKTAQTQVVLQYISTLATLIPFLEASSNQEYLVKRIRELAQGGSISEYRWNSGSNFNGKPWEDHLPTDAAILMHLFATYLDTQLVPLPHQPDARPFTTRHIIRGNEKPGPNSGSVIIREVTEKPPYYNLMVANVTQEVTKGRNNLFHTLLLFLYYQNKIEKGMIGRVNLGKSGLNMLWIIEK